jgi:hypothetical protein
MDLASTSESDTTQPHRRINFFRRVGKVDQKFKLTPLLVKKGDNLAQTLVKFEKKPRHNCDFMAFDTESTQGHGVTLVQIFVDGVVILAHPTAGLEILQHFLPKKTKVVVAGFDSDKDALGKHGTEFWEQNSNKIVDIQQIASSNFSIPTTNLSFLSFNFLGIIQSKSGAKWHFNWGELLTSTNLTDKQHKYLVYAMGDVLCAVKIYEVMLLLIEAKKTR